MAMVALEQGYISFPVGEHTVSVTKHVTPLNSLTTQFHRVDGSSLLPSIQEMWQLDVIEGDTTHVTIQGKFHHNGRRLDWRGVHANEEIPEEERIHGAARRAVEALVVQKGITVRFAANDQSEKQADLMRQDGRVDVVITEDGKHFEARRKAPEEATA